MANKLKILKEKTEILKLASIKYYQNDIEIMSNKEYDDLFDEVKSLEKELGIIISGSPTNNVGAKVLSSLEKSIHEKPMLSLNKTKLVDELISFLGEKKGLISWKIDGLTIVLTYEKGHLVRGVTRGDGVQGEIITHNISSFSNIPLKINYEKKLVIRGEAYISYSSFKRLNDSFDDIESKYKNPRNLASGTVRQLSNEVVKGRDVKFLGFTLSYCEKNFKKKSEELIWLQDLGFDVVEAFLIEGKDIEDKVLDFKKAIPSSDIPSDGLVLTFDDIEYSNSLGETSKFPRDSIAFKWDDIIENTVLRDVLWSPSRTGLINPIAIFDSVEIEGTMVSRASLHNASIFKSLELGIGDQIEVYKANMIIPQVEKNLTRSGDLKIPDICPVCKQKANLENNNDVEVLRCINPNCPIKKVKSFVHFVSRSCMNIEGLSEKTLEKFIDKGFLKNLVDIFKLKCHREEIIEMEGFGEKSYNNIVSAIEEKKVTSLDKFLNSLGIEGVGSSNAKLISKYFKDMESIFDATFEDLINIDGIGPVLAESFVEFFKDEFNKNTILNLLEYVKLNEVKEANSFLLDLSFVVTGSLKNYKSRNDLKEEIEFFGGNVSSSVSKNTDYLINNDTNSLSNKNQKAKALGVKIISEDDYIKLVESKRA